MDKLFLSCHIKDLATSEPCATHPATAVPRLGTTPHLSTGLWINAGLPEKYPQLCSLLGILCFTKPCFHPTRTPIRMGVEWGSDPDCLKSRHSGRHPRSDPPSPGRSRRVCRRIACDGSSWPGLAVGARSPPEPTRLVRCARPALLPGACPWARPCRLPVPSSAPRVPRACHVRCPCRQRTRHV